ncbi:MAG: restriction endonuclease subunit S, partial [Bacilli bacterium]
MEVKQGYKETEIGVIPSDWEVRTLGEVGDVKMCRRVFNHETQIEGIIPFYKIGTFGKEADAYITEELYKNYRKRFSFPNKGDILISAAGTIGRTIIYDGKPAYFQDSNIVWIDNSETLISNKFLYYVFQVVKYNTEGGTIQRLYNSILKSAKFVKPSESEQTAIATALSDADSYIASLEKLIAKKHLIKQGAMQQLLKPKEGWVVKKFSKLVWYQEGPGVRNHQFKSSGIKLLNGTNIEKGKLLLEKTDRFISESEAYGWYSHFLVDSGDILIACSGITVDRFDEKVTIAETHHLPLCMNTSTMRFKIISDDMMKLFFFHFLKSKSFKEQIGGKATGSAQLNFGPSHVQNVDIAYPKPAEQTRIATILSDM